MYVIVGANHRSCDGRLRDLLFTEEIEVPVVLSRLRAAGLAEGLWLSTCDRVEVHLVHPDPDDAVRRAIELFAARAGLEPPALSGQVYSLVGDAACRHVFAVASSLDSQVVGEPHVLGQIKEAYRAANAAGMLGQELIPTLQAAFATAKRVRTETAIAERPTSIAAAAVQLARNVHGDIDRCRGLLIGGGDMGLLMIDTLRAAGLGRLTVVSTLDRRAQALARRLDGHFLPVAEIDTALAGADIVVSAVGSGRLLLTPPMIQQALRARRRRPMFLIDAALPTDVAPEVGALDGAFVYDLNDLERVAMSGRDSREAAAVAAWAIVDQAVGAFLEGRASRAAVPTVIALRSHFESVRTALMDQRPGLSADEATRLLINRLLHRPSAMLRQFAAAPDRGTGGAAADADRLVRRLFGLPAADGSAPEPEGGAESVGAEPGAAVARAETPCAAAPVAVVAASDQTPEPAAVAGHATR